LHLPLPNAGFQRLGHLVGEGVGGLDGREGDRHAWAGEQVVGSGRWLLPGRKMALTVLQPKGDACALGAMDGYAGCWPSGGLV